MLQQPQANPVTHKPDLEQKPSAKGQLAFKAVLAGGLIYTGVNLFADT